ncbi:hypothetical protein TIFTF001_020624 [Ficus carica]|uniref:Uncharacterized protein n=1 Tax=Ficus carica TaxID=3494 RepID=A0AA88D9Z1_FICCA|nr:hypothetical protein TIFTF001_020624 [Ficus carica]
MDRARGKQPIEDGVEVWTSTDSDESDSVDEEWASVFHPDEVGIELSVNDFLALYYPQENSKDRGRYSMYSRRKRQVVGEMKNADRYWHDRKKLKKPPPKALLFENKLEQLLVQPNQEWDEINVTSRLKSSSLWKDFIEIETIIIKRIPSWVDWPFVIRGALWRLFGTSLFIEPLFDEEVLIAELALDMMKINFLYSKELLAMKKPSSVPAQPSAKKSKVDEKSKKKAPAKRKELAKATISKTDVKPQQTEQEEVNVEVDLPPRMSLFQNKKLSVGIMRQLLSDVDSDTSTLRGMGLVYRTTEKAVKRRERIKELEDIDREWGERLLDIERKFKYVKASADGLIAEHHTLNQIAKEGA